MGATNTEDHFPLYHIGGFRRNSFLGGHYSDNLFPMVSDSFSIQLHSSVIDRSVGDGSEEKMCFGAFVGLAVYGA
nr:hypothetical protein [uncultured Porphyromonas sp.]